MITGMNHITLAVINIDRSFKFYHQILGLKPLVKWDKGAYFLVGALDLSPETGFWFCLNIDKERIPNPCYTHYAFSVPAADFEAMALKIRDSGAVIFKENSSPGDSLYFLDPDGHKLEIHTGNYQARITAQKTEVGTWKNVEWFV